VSHLGHSSKPFNTTKQLFTLQEQIQHKIECFDIIRKQYGPETNVILIGHSVGSFICTEVLKARPNHNIVRLIALFPTLQHIAKTPNGVALSVSKKSPLAKTCSDSFQTNIFWIAYIPSNPTYNSILVSVFIILDTPNSP
jgi:alpha-beta hydrolase superfamily lysophospholipase